MVRKQDARRSTRVKLSKQSSRKNRKHYLETRKRDGLTNKATFANELNWLLGAEDRFATMCFMAIPLGSPMIWSLQESEHVTDAFDYSLKFCHQLGITQSAKTYPRFMNALTRYNVLSARVRSRVQQCAEEVGGRFWRDNDWVLFASDGSRVSVPRTVSNVDAFCAANYGSMSYKVSYKVPPVSYKVPPGELQGAALQSYKVTRLQGYKVLVTRCHPRATHSL